MSQYVYVIRLAPTGRIKVGRTAKLGSRLANHAANAEFGGTTMDRAYSVACGDAVTAESAIIEAVRALPGARVVHGNETFDGVSFAVAAAIVEDVADRLLDGSLFPAPPQPHPVPPHVSRPIPKLLNAIYIEVEDLPDDARPSSRELRKKLAPEMTEAAFGRQLRKWGCPSGRTVAYPNMGPKVGDVRTAVSRIRLGGPVHIDPAQSKRAARKRSMRVA